MKISMYELLGMIKDDKVPKKIIFDGIIFEYDGHYYFSKNNIILEEYCNLTNSLNDEVEILEEEKKIPEKLGLINYSEDPATSLIHHKVDEIIDYLDYLKSKGE